MHDRIPLLLALALLCIGLSCSDDAPPNTEPGPDFVLGTAKSYFIPLAPGVKLVLTGTLSIVDQRDSLIARDPCEMHFSIAEKTLRSDRDFVVSIMSITYVYTNPADTAFNEAYVRSTADSVLLYNRFLEEAETRVFLKTPLQVDASWEYGDYTAQIVSVRDVLTTPVGLFSQVVRVRFAPPSSGSTWTELYFAKGIGIVRWVDRTNIAGDMYIHDVHLTSKNF